MRECAMSGSSSHSGSGVLVKEELPVTFTVKYLGHAESRGLWGIKNTRSPVDKLVEIARQPGTVLPLMQLTVSKDGCTLAAGIITHHHPIDTISYGVQDLVYTRVFSMIIVRDITQSWVEQHPFECHAFVCDSRQIARKVTYCLATSFQEYSTSVRGSDPVYSKKRFAIDLRSPEDLEAELKSPDSEA